MTVFPRSPTHDGSIQYATLIKEVAKQALFEQESSVMLYPAIPIF
jgi:hypothetical protein